MVLNITKRETTRRYMSPGGRYTSTIEMALPKQETKNKKLESDQTFTSNFQLIGNPESRKVSYTYD